MTARSASPLYRLRSARGWSIEELAARAGISPRTIYNAEVGARQPQRATRRVLALALGCSPEDLKTSDAGAPTTDASPAGRARLASKLARPGQDATPV
jgi:transcriptional regulator with XRE-family HTH domain